MHSSASPKHLVSNSDHHYSLLLKLIGLTVKFSSNNEEQMEGRTPLLKCVLCVQQADLIPLCRMKGGQGTTCLFLLNLNFQSPSDKMLSVTHTVCSSVGCPVTPCHRNSVTLGPQLTWDLPQPLLCVFWAKFSVSSLGTNQGRFSDFVMWNAMFLTLDLILLIVASLYI